MLTLLILNNHTRLKIFSYYLFYYYPIYQYINRICLRYVRKGLVLSVNMWNIDTEKMKIERSLIKRKVGWRRRHFITVDTPSIHGWMYFPQLFFFSIILSLWIIKIVFFIIFIWIILKNWLITPRSLYITFYISYIKIKIKFHNHHNYVLPILNFLIQYNEIKELLIKWLILDRPYSFYSSTGTSIRRSYLSEYNRSRCSPTRWAIPINRG